MSFENNIAKVLNPLDSNTIKNYPSRIYIKLFQEELLNTKNIHLRLFPPKSLGFPKNIQFFKVNKEQWNQISDTKNNVDDFNIMENKSNTLIHFNEPLLYLKIYFNQSYDNYIKCFYKSTKISSDSMNEKNYIVFKIANITDVLIPFPSENIVNISYIKESTVITTLNRSSSAFDISINKTSSILKKLDIMNVNIHNPLEVIEVDAQNSQKSEKISLLKYLNFLALEPRYAKDLGLYGIDTNTDEVSYLYMVKGSYDGDKYCYGFIYPKNIEKLPIIEGKFRLKQMNGITYQNKTPLGQISLNWNYENSRAVFYEIQRLNKAHQVVVTYSNHMISKNSKYCFTEKNLPLNDIIYYKVTPIDIFGRRGETVQSDNIVLKNNSVPVPAKNIKAKIIQNGFPWNNIEEYKNKEINKGIAHISFEYGEQQQLVSPDVDKVTLLYRVGSKREDDWNHLDKWNTLESIKIKPPIKGLVTFENTLEMLVFPCDIKEVREKVYKDENNEEIFYTELLLNEVHLEPDLFKNFTFEYKSNVFNVVNSHAGVAYHSDNTTNKNYTTRLILEGKNYKIEPTESIKLIPSKSSELLVLITFKPSGNLEEVSGGEITLNMQYYNNNGEVSYESFIGKVISNIRKIPNKKISVIARFKEKKLNSILKDEKSSTEIRMGVHYYAPYLLSNQSLIVNDTSVHSKISIDIKDEAFETVWFSAITHQKEFTENISSLAIPFETKVMNPPEILIDIPIPKLCKDKKYAPPANVDGYSNPRICWESNLSSVKYELSRALDKTIIATDKKNWLQGISTTISKNPIFGTIESASKDNINGKFTLKVKGNEDFYSTLKSMEQGRIKIKGIYHQLLKVINEEDENNEKIIKLLCKPFIDINNLENISDETTFLAESVPSYTEIENNDDKLKELANIKSNSSAFGLVTSVAVDGNSFTDTIPAKGSNRFFYKLRVVFASGHKSAWSACSEGVYQFPSIPQQIENFTVVKYKGQYMVSWEKPLDSNIDGYLFYKKEEDETLKELKEVKSDELTFKPRFIPENLLLFSKPLLINSSTDILESEEEIESYLWRNISIVGLKENSTLEIKLYGDESSLLYETKENTYYLKGLKHCSENLSDLEKVKVNVLNPKEDFEEIVGRDENVYVVYLEEEELHKDDLIVVPYVNVMGKRLK